MPLSCPKTTSVGYYSVGAFPPPWCGVSFVNQRVRDLALAAGISVGVFNTSAPYLDGRALTRFRRLCTVLTAFVRFLRRKVPRSALYLSASGGYALLYEAAFALTARMAQAPIVIHHNSFRYINKRFRPMKLLRWCAGREAVHIMLSESMARRFVATYGIVKYLCVSNCAFLRAPTIGVAFKFQDPWKVGFFSNLSVEKGLEDVIKLAEVARNEGRPWQFLIAGPFASQQVESQYRPRFEALPNVKLLGPLRNEEKRDFYSSLDVFVMPTRYFNEAEPIVVLEAMQYGVPVIAYGRGVLPEVLQSCGVVIRDDQQFIAVALRIMARWQSDRREYVKMRDATVCAYETLFDTSCIQLDKLLALLSGNQVGRVSASS